MLAGLRTAPPGLLPAFKPDWRAASLLNERLRFVDPTVLMHLSRGLAFNPLRSAEVLDDFLAALDEKNGYVFEVQAWVGGGRAAERPVPRPPIGTHRRRCHGAKPPGRDGGSDAAHDEHSRAALGQRRDIHKRANTGLGGAPPLDRSSDQITATFKSSRVAAIPRARSDGTRAEHVNADMARSKIATLCCSLRRDG